MKRHFYFALIGAVIGLATEFTGDGALGDYVSQIFSAELLDLEIFTSEMLREISPSIIIGGIIGGGFSIFLGAFSKGYWK